jgi:DNA-binding CsgD family transcriptional regulator
MVPPNEFRSPSLAPTLTAREMEVLALLMSGKTNLEISRELFVAESTVKAHMGSIFVKLGVSTRTEAAVVGWETFPMLRVVSSPRS